MENATIGYSVLSSFATKVELTKKEEKALAFFRDYQESVASLKKQVASELANSGSYIFDRGFLDGGNDLTETIISFEVSSRIFDYWKAWSSAMIKLDSYFEQIDDTYSAENLPASYHNAISDLHKAVNTNYAKSWTAIGSSMLDSLAGLENALPAAWKLAEATFAAPVGAVAEAIETVGKLDTIVKGVGGKVEVARALYQLVVELTPSLCKMLTTVGAERIQATANVTEILAEFGGEARLRNLEEIAKGFGDIFTMVVAIGDIISFIEKSTFSSELSSNHAVDLIQFFAERDLANGVSGIYDSATGFIDLINSDPVSQNILEASQAVAAYFSSTDWKGVNLTIATERSDSYLDALSAIGNEVDYYFSRFLVKLNNYDEIVSTSTEILNSAEADYILPITVAPPENHPPYLTLTNVSAAKSTEGDFTDENFLSFLVQVHGEMTKDISFTVNTYPDTNSNGAADYAEYSQHPVILSASEGQDTYLIQVPIVGDHLPEREESFEVRLKNIVGAETRFASDLRAIGWIRDDDAAVLSLSELTSSDVAIEHYRTDSFKIVTLDSGSMSIDLSEMPTEVEVRVYDYLGSDEGELLGYQFIPQGETGRIELAHTANGLYFIEVTGITMNPDGYRIQVSSPPSAVNPETSIASPDLPDLIVSDLKLNGETISDQGTSVQTFHPGDRIELSADIKNSGDGVVGLSTTAIISSEGLTISPSQTVTTAVLSSGSTTVLNGSSIDIAEDIAPGTYTIAVVADQGKRVDESNENNNTKQIYIKVVESPSANEPTVPSNNTGYGVDISVENVRLDTSSVSQGGELTVSYEVVNRGTIKSEAGEVFILRKNDPSAIVSRFEGENGYSSLEPGERDVEFIRFDIRSYETVGTHYLNLSTRDVDGDMDESNNRFSLTYEVTEAPAPSGISDLLISNFTIEKHISSYRHVIPLTDNSKFYSDDTIYVKWTSSHLGEEGIVEANGSIGFYLSDDPFISTDDLLLDYEDYHTFWSGRAYNESRYLTALPDDLVPGSYFLGAIIDIDDQTGESIEENNISEVVKIDFMGPRTVDLTVSAATLSASSIEHGDTFDIITQIQNLGSFPAYNSRFQIWLSEDAIIGNGDDILLEEVRIDKIFPDEYSGDIATTISSEIALGDYHLFIETNGDGGIKNEQNFSNNLLYAGTLLVTNPSPPTISGNVLGSTSEDGVLTARGALTATKGNEETEFVAISNSEGSWGSFSIDETGAWTYNLDNNLAQSLSPDTVEFETFVVQAQSSNGGEATQEIQISVFGASETPTADGFKFAETGTLLLNHTSQTIALQRSYDSPVVIAYVATENGPDPVNVRISEVRDDALTLHLQEPNYLDGLHATERVNYIVVEEGTWILPDGTLIEAGSINSNKLTSDGFEDVTFNAEFESTPTILSQVQTSNGSDFVTTRQTGANEDTFKLAMQEEEALNDGGHTTENVGWVAIEMGNQAADEASWLANSISGITQAGKDVESGKSFNNGQYVIATLSSFAGPDTAWVRGNGANNSTFNLSVEEEKSADIETSHTTETIDYFTFSEPSTMEGYDYNLFS